VTAARNAERGTGVVPSEPRTRTGSATICGEWRFTQPEPFGSEGVDERVEIDLFRVHQ